MQQKLTLCLRLARAQGMRPQGSAFTESLMFHKNKIELTGAVR
jgi:hypothetical protein